MMTRTFILSLFAAGALSTTACASAWPELDSVEQFGEAFDADQGEVRIVLLLSPT